ncbi:uncharacterized protein LOC9325404 [Arabidopsis lyrata subsp. lyrata]|nr:uncharacterized protein LOC9325404 [Arabidopsis lyrata subsp. lyrata]|eukprot:XP_002889340.2 uncharacterized protein LOC9325404 [Arabidopsis lyrata subsp. lyrata]
MHVTRNVGKSQKLHHVSLKQVLSYLEPHEQEDTKPVTSTKKKGFLLFNSHQNTLNTHMHGVMNSSCIDFVMFSRGQHDEDNMSRRPWKRERSMPTQHHHHLNLSPNEDEELANCLVLLSNSGDAHGDHHKQHGHGKAKTVKKQKTAQVFQCKACKKVFTSHQALGGHRASHKKVKGCFASQDKEEEEEEEYKEDDDEDEDEDEEEEEDKSTAHIARKRSNAHECTICHRVFSSGQALGGHKRCHWLTPSNYLRMTSLHDHHHSVGRPQPLDQPSLDLNLACQEYSVDPTAMSVGMIERDGGGNSHNATSSSWLKLASGDWS